MNESKQMKVKKHSNKSRQIKEMNSHGDVKKKEDYMNIFYRKTICFSWTFVS